MKLICKENHWKIDNNHLVLDTPEGTEALLKMVAGIEAKVRLEIYEAICDLKLLENRKAITKAGIDNVALAVQALCADVALGNQ